MTTVILRNKCVSSKEKENKEQIFVHRDATKFLHVMTKIFSVLSGTFWNYSMDYNVESRFLNDFAFSNSFIYLKLFS